MKICNIIAREIFDSRAMPTIECDIILSSGELVRASIPSGLSKSSGEPIEKRDPDRLMGRGVQSAIQIINEQIKPILIGQEPNVIEIDQILLQMDGTPTKRILGANTILAVSTAVCKAQALTQGIEVYELIAHLCEVNVVSIPLALFNIINGGMHAHNEMALQELMIMPIGVTTFKEAMSIAVEIFWHTKEILIKKKLCCHTGDEGGFAPKLPHITDAFDLLCQIIADLGLTDHILFAIDVAASHLYDTHTGLYTINNEQLTSHDMVEWYIKLIGKYPIYSIEDGIAEYDLDGWHLLHKSLSSSVQLVGDDIFSSNITRIVHGLEQDIVDAVLIKPTQAGTITQTLQAVKLCHEYNIPIVVSHRSGETNDDFIADLAIGCGAINIKAGGCLHGERLAKYHRLLNIEEHLIAMHQPAF